MWQLLRRAAANLATILGPLNSLTAAAHARQLLRSLLGAPCPTARRTEGMNISIVVRLALQYNL
jgi:hypothetical protein